MSATKQIMSVFFALPVEELQTALDIATEVVAYRMAAAAQAPSGNGSPRRARRRQRTRPPVVAAAPTAPLAWPHTPSTGAPTEPAPAPVKPTRQRRRRSPAQVLRAMTELPPQDSPDPRE